MYKEIGSRKTEGFVVLSQLAANRFLCGDHRETAKGKTIEIVFRLETLPCGDGTGCTQFHLRILCAFERRFSSGGYGWQRHL